MKKHYALLVSFFILSFFNQSYAQYQINGDGVSLGGGCYQLTANAGNQHGSVWNINQINLNFPFDFTFNVFLGCSNGGADGICFGLQPNSAGIGATGNGMGLGGVTPSLGVFIDTYQNTGDGDPTYDHISINSNGDVNHSSGNNLSGPVQASSTNADVEDCANHTLRVSWNPATLTYSVWFDGVLRLNLVGNNIINTVFGGNPNVFWGFTGSTGGSTNLQKFCIILVSNYVNNTICQGTATQFADSSYSGTSITNWRWNFGDGTPIFTGGVAATYQNPLHTFANPGTYNVSLTISNSGNDSSTITHNVTVVPYPIVSVTGGTAICAGQSVNLTGTVTGALSGYTWSPTINMTGSNTLAPTVSPQATTTYTLTSTNAPGCTSTDTTTVIVYPASGATFTYASPYCQSDANPLPTYTGAGVAGFFSSTAGLVLNGSTGLVDLATSTPGTYTVTDSVPASGPCGFSIGTAVITISPVPVASFSYTGSPYCSNGSNALPAFAGGGVAGAFTSTAGLVFISTNTGEVDVLNSVPGTYTVTNTVSGGACAGVTATTTITITPSSVATFGYQPTSYCPNAINPSPVFSGGGVAGVFSSTSGLSVNSSTGAITLGSSNPGTYIVTNTIAAVGGCPAFSDTALVILNPTQVATFTYPSNTFCQTGNAPATITGTPGGTFTSTAGLSINASTGAINLGSSASGTYTITYTTAGPCGASATAVITISSPIANAGNNVILDCHIGTVTLSGTGSSTGSTISYSWAPSSGVVSGGNTLSPVVNQIGTYTLTVINSNTPLCPSRDSVVVSGTPAPVASFTANPTSGTPPLTVNFTNTSSAGSTPFWLFPGGSPSSSGLQNPTVIYATTGTYIAYLNVSNASGCTSSDSITISVYDDYSLVVPNVFTPNGDNVNDLFTVIATGVQTIQGDIYDRWGLKLFTWAAVKEGWDGHTTSGQLASEGTYYYIITSAGFDGTTHEDKGFLTLVR